LDTRCKYSRDGARVYNAFLTHEQAREQLDPLYGWCEGFDTRDLKEAKACCKSWRPDTSTKIEHAGVWDL
jgi:hypothetical protein